MIGANYIVHDPAPVVALKGVDAFAIEIDLQFRVRHPADRIPAKNELLDLAYRQCMATGIFLALPPSSAILIDNLDAGRALPESLQEVLQSIPIFAGLKQEELQKLEASATLERYAPGQLFFHGADHTPGLMIVRSGAVSALCDGMEVLRLAPGAIFGQIDGIVRQDTKYEALTVLEAYEIDGAALVSLLGNHPEIQENLTRHLSSLARNVAATDNRPVQAEHASILRRKVQGLLGR